MYSHAPHLPLSIAMNSTTCGAVDTEAMWGLSFVIACASTYGGLWWAMRKTDCGYWIACAALGGSLLSQVLVSILVFGGFWCALQVGPMAGMMVATACLCVQSMWSPWLRRPNLVLPESKTASAEKTRDETNT